MELNDMEKGAAPLSEGAAPIRQPNELIRDEFAAMENMNVNDERTCHIDFVRQLRFAAHIHNCARYNRLELLNFINRPKDLNGTRVDNPLLKRMQNARACWCAWLAIASIWLLVAFFPCLYVTLKRDATGHFVNYLRGKAALGIPNGVWVGLGFLTSVVMVTSFIQLIFGPKLRSDSHFRYKVSFYVYYWVYKWWQSKFILGFTPRLVYNNHCLVNASCLFPRKNLDHVGIFVVGIAVNTIQCLWLMIILNVVVAAVSSENTREDMAADVAVAWVIVYAMHRSTVFAMGLLLGQSSKHVAMIDDNIRMADKSDGLDGLLHNMMANELLVLHHEHLVQLADYHDIKNPEDIRPSATCVLRISIVVKLSMGSSKICEVNLADGSVRCLL